jgi:hypothetical protein
MEVTAAALHEMLTLHPDLQQIVDEQQPMSMDVLSALHPVLQQIVDEQQALLMLTLQLAVPLELLPLPPPLPSLPFAPTSAAASSMPFSMTTTSVALPPPAEAIGDTQSREELFNESFDSNPSVDAINMMSFPISTMAVTGVTCNTLLSVQEPKEEI